MHCRFLKEQGLERPANEMNRVVPLQEPSDGLRQFFRRSPLTRIAVGTGADVEELRILSPQVFLQCLEPCHYGGEAGSGDDDDESFLVALFLLRTLEEPLDFLRQHFHFDVSISESG